MKQAQRSAWGWGLAALLVAGSASAASWQDQLSSAASQLNQQNSGSTTLTSRNLNRSPSPPNAKEPTSRLALPASCMLSIGHQRCPSALIVDRMSASMRVIVQLVSDLIFHFAGFITHLLSQALFVVAVMHPW